MIDVYKCDGCGMITQGEPDLVGGHKSYQGVAARNQEGGSGVRGPAQLNHCGHWKLVSEKKAGKAAKGGS